MRLLQVFLLALLLCVKAAVVVEKARAQIGPAFREILLESNKNIVKPTTPSVPLPYILILSEICISFVNFLEHYSKMKLAVSFSVDRNCNGANESIRYSNANTGTNSWADQIPAM